MGGVSEEGQPKITNATQYSKIIAETARKVAYDLRLPWELLALRGHASHYKPPLGAFEKWKEHARSSGLEWEPKKYIRIELRRELERYAKARRPSPPPEETVREVYDAYSESEWKNLIADLDRAGLEPLLSFLQTNRHQPTRARGNRLNPNTTQFEADDVTQRVHERAIAARAKYGAVFEAAVKRSMILKFSQGDWRTIPISDPVWAAVWKEVGAPPTSRDRFPAELSGSRAIAEALGYDPDNKHKQVTAWLERMQELPFEKFVANYSGDLSDYLTWVHSPRIHNMFQSRQRQREE